MNRRNFLARAGVGVCVTAVGTPGVAGSATGTGPSVLSTFEATATAGFLDLDANIPKAPITLEENFVPIPFANEYNDYNVTGTLEITGGIRDDGTWKLDTVTFPQYRYHSMEPIDAIYGIEVQATDHATPGTFDPTSGLVSVPMTMEIDSSGIQHPQPLHSSDTVSTAPETDSPDANSSELPLSFAVDPTTETSGEMSGGLRRLTESRLRLTLVDNEFAPETDSEEDSLLGQPGYNWLKMRLDMTVEDPSALAGVPIEPPAVIGDNTPTDPDGDGRVEDIRGDGEFDAADVQALFDNLDNPAVQRNAENYNFSGGSSEEVTVFDVQSLFSKLG